MNPPKVILIGGCPGAGKTTLGREIATRLGYTSLTIDDLLNAAKAITTPESHPSLHAINQPSSVEYFMQNEIGKLIDDATAQHEAIWPAVERIIRNHATWGTPIVIDGWHLRPEWTQQLNLDEVSAHWLIIDPRVLETRERKNDEFFRFSDNPEQMRQNFLARSLWHNSLIASQAESVGDHVLKQDGTQTVDALFKCVESRFTLN